MTKTIKKTARIFLFTVILTAIVTPQTVQAATNMVPTYEVKFLLDSDQVLNKEHLLKKEYRNYFNTDSDYLTMGMLYLDTDMQDFNNEGWINRIRIKEGASDFELTYKKRYSIQNGNTEEALALANQEGFDSTDTNYSAEIDWGYSKMTLSLSCKKEKSNKGYDNLELPKKNAAIDMIKDKMPGKEENWLYENWGKDIIENAKKAGPVYCYRYEGEYNGTDIDIEIVPIENQASGETTYVTEVSFKEDDYTDASEIRENLMNDLDGLNILEHKDSLKTQLILDAYLGN